MSTAKPHRRLSLTQPTQETNTHEETTTSTAASGGAEQFEALGRRLDHYEERLERLLTLVEMSAAREEITPARRDQITAPFQVVDHGGRILMTVEAGAEGASLRLFGNDGVPVAMISAESQGGGLAILNNAGQPVATIFTHGFGGGIAVRDGAGAPAAALASQPGGGNLRVFGPQGNAAATLGTHPSGGRLDLHRSDGRQAVQVAVRDTGGGLAVYDRGGELAGVFAADATGGRLGLVTDVPHEAISTRPAPRPPVTDLPSAPQPTKAVGFFISGGGSPVGYDRAGAAVNGPVEYACQ